MVSEYWFFGSFLVVVISILLIDLGLFSRKDHAIKLKEAIAWSIVWIACGLAFYIFIDFRGDMIHGVESPEKLAELVAKYKHPITLTGNFEIDLSNYKNNLSIEFLSGYLIEYALSVDNIFVMIMIFSAFGVSERYYKRVLFWGVMGAIIMRFTFIFLGAALINKFEWVLYIFGAILIFTGGKMFFDNEEDKKIDPAKHPITKFAIKYFHVFPKYVGQHFFVKRKGRNMITPLFVVLLVIEFTDLIFAVDSVPAIFAITKDPYIVFFSNIFAIMGLRSLFFLLSNILHLFRFLKIGLGVLLVFIGLKMILHHWLEELGFTNAHSLFIILSILVISIVTSVIFPDKKHRKKHHGTAA